MKLYFSLNQIPELQAYSKRERRELFREAWSLARRSSMQLWAYAVVFGVIFAFIFAALNLYDLTVLEGSLVCGAVGGAIAFVLTPVRIAIARPYLKTVLGE